VIIHHVFFWLKDPNSPDDLARLVTGVRSLAGIEPVRSLYVGTPADTERRDAIDASYSVSELLFFDDLAGQRAYQEHPLHRRFVEQCAPLWKRCIVYDCVASP